MWNLPSPLCRVCVYVCVRAQCVDFHEQFCIRAGGGGRGREGSPDEAPHMLPLIGWLIAPED